MEGAASLIIAMKIGSTVERHALDLRLMSSLQFDAASALGGGAELELALFAETLGELGVESGRLATPSAESCVLPPRPLGRYTAELPEDGPVVWESTETYGPLLSDTRLPDVQGLCRCAEFTLELDVIPDPELALFTLPLSDSRLLAVMASGTLRVFSEANGAQSSTVTRAEGLVGVQITTGVTDPAGGAWLGSSDGGLWRATLSNTLEATRIAQSVRGAPIRAMVVVDPVASELYVLDAMGKLDRLQGETWTERYDFGEGSAHAMLASDLEGRVLAVVSHPLRTLLVDPRGVETLPSPSFQGSARALAFVPRMGFVLGGQEGELVLLDEGRWTPIVNEGTLRGVYALLPYDDGFMYGGDFGFLGQVLRRGGRCAIDARGAEPLGTLHRLGRDLLSLPRHRDFETVETRVSRFRYDLH